MAPNPGPPARVADTPAFARAHLAPGLIERSREALFPPRAPASDRALAAIALAELLHEQDGVRGSPGGTDPHSPWNEVDGWRLNEDSHHDFVFIEGEAQYPVTVRFLAAGQRVAVAGREYALEGERLEGDLLLVRLDGRAFKARALRDGTRRPPTSARPVALEKKAAR